MTTHMTETLRSAQRAQVDVIGCWLQYLGGNGAAGRDVLQQIMPSREQPQLFAEQRQPDVNVRPFQQVFADTAYINGDSLPAEHVAALEEALVD